MATKTGKSVETKGETKHFLVGKCAIIHCCDRYVYSGRVKKVHSDGFIEIEDAVNMRWWGTDKGIGQLAVEGPQPHTKIDLVSKSGAIVLPRERIVSFNIIEEAALEGFRKHAWRVK